MAMGVAGESLAQFTGQFVELSIPKIRTLQPHRLGRESFAMLGQVKSVALQVQPYTLCGERCYALLACNEDGYPEALSSAPAVCANGSDSVSGQWIESAVLRHLNEIRAATVAPCLAQWAALLEEPLRLGEPYLVGRGLTLPDLVLPEIGQWPSFWAVEINYRLENQPFTCDLVLLLPPQVQPSLLAVLDRLLLE